MSDAKLDLILAKLAKLEQDVGSLKQGQEALRGDLAGVQARQAETVAAFKHNWSDMADLYRRVREDVTDFENRLESKLSQINQSIQALRDSIERQDFRADELGRRVSRLEEQPRGL